MTFSVELMFISCNFKHLSAAWEGGAEATGARRQCRQAAPRQTVRPSHERHITALSLDVIMGAGSLPFFVRRRHFGCTPSPAISASALPHLTYAPSTFFPPSLPTLPYTTPQHTHQAQPTATTLQLPTYNYTGPSHIYYIYMYENMSGHTPRPGAQGWSCGAQD